MNRKISLFPLTGEVNSRSHLTVGGVDMVDLANELGTPLYVFDEHTLRQTCREFKSNFNKHLEKVEVVYAGKAFLCKALATLLKEEGMGLDVVSAGEIAIALAGGFDLRHAYLHGNNKSDEDIRVAIRNGIGVIVADGFDDIRNINRIAASLDCQVKILLRISPNVDAHTHRFISTGLADSKFGIPFEQAQTACLLAMALPNLDLLGFHCHIGSQILQIEPFVEAVKAMIALCAKSKEWGLNLRKLNLGGGYAIAYTLADDLPNYSDYAQAVALAIKQECQKHQMDVPSLVIEPGRAIVGRAGLALYSVGNIKEIKGVRKYVAVDGGMSDNIRPALYDAKYTVMVANRALDNDNQSVSICGPFCESSDILVKNADMPSLEKGDILAVAATGAYCLSMSSNYNGFCRPAVVFVKDGSARLVRRRQNADDLLKCDI